MSSLEGLGSAGSLPNIDDPLISKFAEYTRMRLRDFPELNRLTEGFDHSPRFLKWAVIDTISDWISTPPFLGGDLQTILDRGLIHVFSKGVAINAIESLGILHMRNYLAYSDGGVNVQTENPQLIMSWLAMAKSEYEQKKQRIKIALNIENALGSTSGGVHSELYFINSFFGYL